MSINAVIAQYLSEVWGDDEICTEGNRVMDLELFFKNEVKPALGCTETGAVAYAAAAAAVMLDSPPARIHLKLSANIYKNGKNVGIPGTPGLTGNRMAAALGALAGNPAKKLEALADIRATDIEQAEALVHSGQVTEEVVSEVPEVFVAVELVHGQETASAIVAGRHDRLAEVRKNGRLLRQPSPDNAGESQTPAYSAALPSQDMPSLWRLSQRLSDASEQFLLAGAEMNMAAARLGLERPWGLGIGYALNQLNPQHDLLLTIKSVTAAAADVRMAGGACPVMSSAGSGNHGITAILPPVVAARHWHKSPRELAEALALSHLVTAYIKLHTGLLTPVCGCAMAAGIGAAAAIVKLHGGNPQQADMAAASLMSAVLGMICDGAKGSCALKVSAAAGEAYLAALSALAGYGVKNQQGLVSESLPKTAQTIEKLMKSGMSALDATMLNLLRETA